MSTTTHDFKERLAWSLTARHEVFWDAVYRKAFPSLARTEIITDLALQKLGVDRLLVLGNGIELTVDEKKRECADPGDILLEYRHEGHYNADGWMEKDATIDYLAYAFIPNRRCYLFDWRMLRRAWLCHKDEWMARFRHIKSNNERYVTWCLAVPTDVLQRAVLSASVIEVDP
jgi:hypothetical protein